MSGMANLRETPSAHNGHAKRLWRALWPDSVTSLVVLTAIASALLFGGCLVAAAFLGDLACRDPTSIHRAWLQYGPFAAVFVLSGVVAGLLSRRWLHLAGGLAIVLRRVMVLASVCWLFGLLGLMLLVTFAALCEEAPLGLAFTAPLRWRILAPLLSLWLFWVIGGLLGSLPPWFHGRRATRGEKAPDGGARDRAS